MNLKLKDLSSRFIFAKNRLRSSIESSTRKSRRTTLTQHIAHPFEHAEIIPSSEVFDHQLVHVKVSHIKTLRFCLASMTILVLSLGFTVYKLNSRTNMQMAENAKLQSRIAVLKVQVDTALQTVNSVNAEKLSNSSKARNYIEDIQSKLKTINNYLTKRGLKVFPFKQLKVQDDQPKSAEVLFSSYNSYLNHLVDMVAIVPMGYPRESSFTSFFGYRSNPFDFGNSEFHPGLDFKGNIGDPVRCTASGTVIFTGRAGGYGNCVRIKHTGNLQTWYGHLSHISVHQGQKVTVGEVIGKVGSTGRSTGPHLHYEVRENGKPVNPARYLSLN
jgi:murein DD-endopeptidase MepM/ murein hydrolase activator NlpD